MTKALMRSYKILKKRGGFPWCIFLLEMFTTLFIVHITTLWVSLGFSQLQKVSASSMSEIVNTNTLYLTAKSWPAICWQHRIPSISASSPPFFNQDNSWTPSECHDNPTDRRGGRKKGRADLEIQWLRGRGIPCSGHYAHSTEGGRTRATLFLLLTWTQVVIMFPPLRRIPMLGIEKGCITHTVDRTSACV